MLTSKRKASCSCTWWLLGSLLCCSSYADEGETILASAEAAAQLYHAGDVLAAKSALEGIVRQEPTPDSHPAYRTALGILIEVCESVYDYGCVDENFFRLLKLPISPEQEELQMLENTYYALVHLALWSEYLAEGADHVESVFEVFEASRSRMLAVAPEWYIGANLAQARTYLSLGRTEEANLSLSQAIAALVTMARPPDFSWRNILGYRWTC